MAPRLPVRSFRAPLAQSAASRAITVLEARHDTKLSDRVGRRIELKRPNSRSAIRHLAAGYAVREASQTIASYWLPGTSSPSDAPIRRSRSASRSDTRSVFEEALSHLGIEPGALRIQLELPSNEAVRAAVEAGLGAIVISASVAAQSIEAGLLHQMAFRRRVSVRPEMKPGATSCRSASLRSRKARLLVIVRCSNPVSRAPPRRRALAGHERRSVFSESEAESDQNRKRSPMPGLSVSWWRNPFANPASTVWYMIPA